MLASPNPKARLRPARAVAVYPRTPALNFVQPIAQLGGLEDAAST
jgi:hypothetical protein